MKRLLVGETYNSPKKKPSNRCEGCGVTFATESNLTKHYDTSQSCQQNNVTRRSQRRPEPVVIKLSRLENNQMRQMIMTMACSYQRFKLSELTRLYTETYPLLFTVRDRRETINNVSAGKLMIMLLSDAKKHGVHEIKLSKFYGELIYQIILLIAITLNDVKTCVFSPPSS